MTRRSLPGSAWLIVLTFALAVRPAHGQQPPGGWAWQLDRPARLVDDQTITDGEWRFQEMIPGMHITSGPGVTLFVRTSSAAGRFMVDAELLLFPNSADGGYGVMFGGRTDAASTDRLVAWNALLVAGDGRYAVVRRSGERTDTLIEWTAHEAVVRRGSDVVTNRVRVWAERDSVRFIVNGTQVGALPAAAAPPDGRFGLRFDPGINLHVTNVDIVTRLLKRR